MIQETTMVQVAVCRWAGASLRRPNPTGQIPGWKSILNTLAMTYGERLEINEPCPLTQKI